MEEIEAVVTRLEQAGVRREAYGFPFQDQRGIATFDDGTKVAWITDPDANILSVAQVPR